MSLRTRRGGSLGGDRFGPVALDRTTYARSPSRRWRGSASSAVPVGPRDNLPGETAGPEADSRPGPLTRGTRAPAAPYRIPKSNPSRWWYPNRSLKKLPVLLSLAEVWL